MPTFREVFNRTKQAKKESFRSLAKKTGLSVTYLNFLANGRSRPTQGNIEAIARALDIDPMTVEEYRWSRAAEMVGEDKALAEMVLFPEKAVKSIPVLGKVPADNLREAFENRLDTVPAFGGADFAIIASGDCLIGAHIEDGDIIYIKKQARATNGDLVLARYGEEVTLKFYYSDNRVITLKPANPEFENIVLKQVEIIGVKVAVLKRG